MATSLLNKINSALSKKLKHFTSGLEYNQTTGRIMGIAISSDFEGIDHGKRQQRLAKVLKSALTEHEMKRVGPVVTMTPDEAKLHEESGLDAAG